jgi:hypothetical protein
MLIFLSKASLDFAGQRFTTLTMIYTCNMLTKFVKKVKENYMTMQQYHLYILDPYILVYKQFKVVHKKQPEKNSCLIF